jgi:hypothetical protein
MKEINRYREDSQYIIKLISQRGERAITGVNYGDEISHNALDSNSSKLDINITHKFCAYANDGDFWDWNTYLERGIKYSKPGALTNSTSYWGLGVTKSTWWLDGCPEFTAHRWNDTFYLRKWEYDITVPNGEYSRIGGNEKLADGGVDIVEYEITKEKYNELCTKHEFDVNSSLIVVLRRFEDSEIDYNQNKIVDSMNLGMMSYNGKMITSCKVNGKLKKSRQLYYPQVKEVGPNFLPIWNFRELPRVQRNYLISGGIFDVYLYSHITKAGENVHKSDGLFNATDGGKDIIKIAGRGINPRQIWINKKGTTLSSYDIYGVMKAKTKDREIASNTTMIFHQTGGSYEFPKIKTEKPTDIVQQQVAQLHLDEVTKNKKIQYSSKKVEDGKVDRDMNDLTSEKGHKHNKLGLTESIEFITNETITKNEIRNSDNHEVRETQTDGRNYDWLIGRVDDDKFVFHAEYMNDSEDWSHIDQTNFKLLSKVAYYNVLVVDKFGTSSKKLNTWKKNLEQNSIDCVLYVAQRNDFLKGETSKFKKIN